MMFALLVALAVDATPPPTIITTKTSTLCQAVKNEVAPAIAGLAVQDNNLRQAGAVVNDMIKMQNMGGDTWVDYENMHLWNAVDALASNNIKIHQLLDKLAALKIRNAEEAAQVAELRAKLLAVADKQAAMLNVFSGAAATESLSELSSDMVDIAKANNVPVSAIQMLVSSTIPVPEAAVGAQASVEQAASNNAEKYVTAALAPVVQHCL